KRPGGLRHPGRDGISDQGYGGLWLIRRVILAPFAFTVIRVITQLLPSGPFITPPGLNFTHLSRQTGCTAGDSPLLVIAITKRVRPRIRAFHATEKTPNSA